MTMRSNLPSRNVRYIGLALVACLGWWLPAAASIPKVVAYEDTTCAVVSGAAYCWGGNTNGQLGNGGLSPAFAPTAVPGLSSGVSAISLGSKHACAVVNGGAWCWGFNGS